VALGFLAGGTIAEMTVYKGVTPLHRSVDRWEIVSYGLRFVGYQYACVRSKIEYVHGELWYCRMNLSASLDIYCKIERGTKFRTLS
jgi:hypothetical protein